MDLRVPCSEEGCGGPAALDGWCLSHLPEDQVHAAVVAMTLIDVRDARLTAQRVHAIVAAAARHGHVTQGVDFTSARIEGDVELADIELRSRVTFAGAEFDGSLRLARVTGLSHLQLNDPDVRRARMRRLEVFECEDERHAWTLEDVDVDEEMLVEHCTLRALTLENCRLGKSLRIDDVDAGTLTLLDCHVEGARLDRLRVEDGATIGPIATDRLSITQSAFRSWAEIRPTDAFDARQCGFDGPVRLEWHPRRLMYDLTGDGTEGRTEDESPLSLEAVRFRSTASIRWCGGPVQLPSCVFGGASTLDRTDAAAGTPALGRVDAMDGEQLLFARVDISTTRLSEATSLGPIEPSYLEHGRGAAGITFRRFIADEQGAASPRSLARTYRDLRTSCERAGDYAGANDLHYGERLWQRKAARVGSVDWLWLTAYGLVGYGVRPWRPLALLLVLLVASALAFAATDGLQKDRGLGGSPSQTIASLCAGAPEPTTPQSRQTVACDASFGESLEFAVRSATALIRPAGGYHVTGVGVVIEVVSKLAAALLFGLFVLAMRNRLHR